MSKKQIRLLLFLLGLTILFRAPYLYEQATAFDFDHGRDALAVIHMIKLKQLRFIGPWTSISGLFFGPLYYYLLTPLAWLTNGHPLSQTWTMFLLVIIQVWLAFKYFGFWEAIILATTPGWIILATGSSNAFPMTLVAWLILINLLSVLKTKKTSIKQMFWLGSFLSLGFHFSSALAVFLVLAVPLIFLVNKIKPSIKQILFSLIGFGLVFLPQIMFDLKHNFIEVKAVIDYLKYGEKNILSLNKISYIISQVVHELALASLPEVGNWLLGGIVLGLGLILMLIKKIKFKYWLEFGLLLIIPIIGFSGLHYNPWYSYGLFPVAVLIVAQILKNSPKTIQVIYLFLLLLTPFFGLKRYYSEAKSMIDNSRAFLPIKIRALKYIYDQAQGKPFSSYQYSPEIYDYAYQYLYFWQGFQGKQLPVEFSYKPGEISYVTEKPELLKLFPKAESQAEKTFLILNLPENKYHYPLESWLDQFNIKEVASKKQMSDEVWVWEIKLN